MMEEKCCEKRKERNAETKKMLISRINRIIGQMNGVKRMVEDNRYCDDILVQLSAVDKSVKSVANVILKDHMHSCMVENIEAGNFEILDEIVDLFKRFQ